MQIMTWQVSRGMFLFSGTTILHAQRLSLSYGLKVDEGTTWIELNRYSIVCLA